MADPRVAQALPKPAEMFRLLEENLSDITMLCDPDGLVMYASAATEPMLGWSPPELMGQSADDFVHPDDLLIARKGRSAALEVPGPIVTSYRWRTKEGGYLWTESVTRQVADSRRSGGVILLASIRNIADRKLVETRLQGLALRDPLTGVANRTVLMDHLTLALHRLERDKSVLAVIYLDLDRFKVINDSLGHRVGDNLLIQVAQRTLHSIRPTDTLARIGGDEFVVVAEGLADVNEATRVAQRICSSIEQPIDLDDDTIVCTISAGIATTVDPGHSPEGLLQEADLALYRAKVRGRNRAEVFDEELRTTAIGRLAIEQMLRQAIDEHRLLVHYQPIIDLRTGHVVSAEALVRVQGEHGLIYPDTFIDVAEETGLLSGIDDWVLDCAAKQAAAWRRDLDVPDFRGIAVNITGRHLSDSRFSKVLGDFLADNRLPAGTMSIEVTERTLMEASRSAMHALRTIRSLGVGVGLDDFGTGYSSLAHLRQFPLDFVKIDQSFVRQLGASSEEVAIVTAIIGLAHALHLSVVAEGVETDEELRILTALGCDLGQGFLFGRPAEPVSITELIDSRSTLGELTWSSRIG